MSWKSYRRGNQDTVNNPSFHKMLISSFFSYSINILFYHFFLINLIFLLFFALNCCCSYVNLPNVGLIKDSILFCYILFGSILICSFLFCSHLCENTAYPQGVTHEIKLPMLSISRRPSECIMTQVREGQTFFPPISLPSLRLTPTPHI